MRRFQILPTLRKTALFLAHSRQTLKTFHSFRLLTDAKVTSNCYEQFSIRKTHPYFCYQSLFSALQAPNGGNS